MLGILPSSGPGGMHLKEMLRFQCSQMQFWILKKTLATIGSFLEVGDPNFKEYSEKTQILILLLYNSS